MCCLFCFLFLNTGLGGKYRDKTFYCGKYRKENIEKDNIKRKISKKTISKGKYRKGQYQKENIEKKNMETVNELYELMTMIDAPLL